MASEAQKPLAKMEFLLVCGKLATISLEPCQNSVNSSLTAIQKLGHLKQTTVKWSIWVLKYLWIKN